MKNYEYFHLAVTITVNPKPATPVAKANNASVCLGTSAILTATGCAGTLTWTGNLTGSSVTVTPSKTSTYKALCTVNGCKSDSSTAVTITVTPKPTTPVAKANNASVCLGTSAVLSATGCAGTLTWTGNLTGSSVTVTPTKTSTYKALCTVNGCKSDSSAAVNITVSPKPNAPSITTQATSTNILTQWNKTLGGGANDYLSNIIPTNDGGFLLGGYSGSDISDNKSQASKGLFDYWIVKIDASGNKVWDKTFGGESNDFLNKIISTNDGGYLLGGHSGSNNTGDKSQGSKGQGDYWVVKIDASGNKVWDKTFGGSSVDFALKSIISTSDGGYLLGGTSLSNNTGDKSQISRGLYDYWVIKIDASGNKVWDKTFGGGSSDLLNSIIPTNDGGYLLGGFSYSGIGGDKSEASKGNGYYDYWVVKINANGAKVWDRTIGGSEADVLNDMIATNDGNYLLIGYSNSNIGGDKSESSKGDYDYWVVKINTNGTKIWDKTYGGNKSDVLYSVVTFADGTFLLGGASYSDIGADKSEAPKSDYKYDYWVVKVNANGTKIWDKTLGGVSDDYLMSVISTNDGGYLLGGYSVFNNTGTVDTDYWLVKIKEEKGTTLTATGCAGTVKWSNGATGNTITVNPTVLTSYTATCVINACESLPSSAILVLATAATQSSGNALSANTDKVETISVPNVRVDVTLSATEIEPSYEVFPNPVLDEVKVKTSLKGISTFELYDVVGKKVLEETFEEKGVFSLKHLAKGTYLFKISQGVHVYHGKLMVQ